MKALTFNLPPNVIDGLKLFDGAVRMRVKAELVAGNRFAVRLVDQAKSRDQEEKYHAMVGEISSQLGGDLADVEDAKRILISAFRIDTLKDMADDWAKFGDMRMGRGLRGEVVLLGLQSRKFTSRLGSAFIEWLYAFGDETGVVFTEKVLDPESGQIVLVRRAPRGRVDQETGEIV